MSTLNIPTVELVSTLRAAPENGQTNSSDYNDSWTESLADLASLSGFINDVLIPMLDGLSLSIQPLNTTAPNGIEGRYIFSDTSDTTDQVFFDSLNNTSLDIASSLRVLEGIITTLQSGVTALNVEVTAIQSQLASINQNDILQLLQNITASTVNLTTNVTNLYETVTNAAITFQTNGTPNSIQNTLNIAQGSNVTLTSSGGTVTIAATGGGSSTPGGTNGQIQYNNSGTFAGVTYVPLGNGGVGVSLSATGGASEVLRQSTSGGTITVSKLAYTDVTNAIGGTISANQVAVGSSSGVIAGYPNLTFNNSTQILTLTGTQTFVASVSGSATIGVASNAGTPATLLLPTTTGAPGSVLQTNGASPQQLSWGNANVSLGPAPWIDITAYGARAINTYETTTATTNGTSAVSLASIIDFMPGDGIVIYKAGAVTSQTTPSAPTAVCAAVTGTNTINYKCVGVDINGGLTTASALVAVANAPASFGSYPVGIANITQTAGVVTVNTTTPIGVIAGQQVTITGVHAPGTAFIGSFPVATAPTTSQFTYLLAGNAGAGTVFTNYSTARICNTYNINAITRTGTTISITTNANHNYGAQLSNNYHAYTRTIAIVQGIEQQTNPTGTADLNGQYTILTAASNLLTLDSALDYVVTETGNLTTGNAVGVTPTVTVYEYITVTCPALSGTTVSYYVYADYADNGSFVLVGKTLPYQTTFIDYGTWQNYDFGAPSYVPTTPPSGPVNQIYAGTITGISGNNITVSPGVTATGSSLPVMHDNSVALSSAITEANTVHGGTVYFPPAVGSYIINAPVSITANTAPSFLVGCAVIVNETISMTGGTFMSWKAAPGVSQGYGVTQFGQAAPVPIGGLANPILLSTNGVIQVEGLGFGGDHSCGMTYINTLYGGGNNFRAIDCLFIVGGNNIGTSIPVVIASGSGYQACPHFTNCVFIGYSVGAGNGSQVGGGNINISPNIPLLSLRADEAHNPGPNGLILDGNNTFAGRGILFDGSFGQFTAQADISIYENEAPTTPTVMILGTASGGGNISLSHFQNDSQEGAIIANWAAFTSPPNVTIDNCVMSGYSSIITGSAIPGLIVKNCNQAIGQNFNYQTFTTGQGGESYGSLTTVQYQGLPIIMTGPANPPIAVAIPPVSGVTCSPSGVSTFPYITADTYYIYVTAIGWNGYENLVSVPASVTVNGSQGILSSWTISPGVMGYNVYASSTGLGFPKRQNGSIITTNSYTFTNLSNEGVTPSIDNTGMPLIDQHQIVTPLLRIAGSTSGAAVIQTAAAAGSPNPVNLPTSTGASGQVLTTDGANPQQLSWQYTSATSLPTPTTVHVVSPTITSTGDFTVAHGLGSIPRAAIIQMTSGGNVYFQYPAKYDATNLYLIGTDTGVSADLLLWT